MKLKCDTTKISHGLHFDYSLKRLNTWRVGGAADCFYKAEDLRALSYFLKHCVGEHPLFYLGLGSNILVRDGGLRGIVLSLGHGFNWIEQHSEHTICAGGSVSCAQLARFYVNHGLPGLEFMVGVPGTIGGALKMNAGAFGSEIWDYVVSVETVDRHGLRKHRSSNQVEVGYRFADLPDEECIVSGEFKAPPPSADIAALKQQLKSYLEVRRRTQPVNVPTCGSVFKNLQGSHAGQLIEECGLKGYRRGGAMVSDKHANFIVNLGHATAADIEQLIVYVQSVVAEQVGVHLQPEVVIIGEHHDCEHHD